MKEANFESYHIRKWYTQIEDSLANETGFGFGSLASETEFGFGDFIVRTKE